MRVIYSLALTACLIAIVNACTVMYIDGDENEITESDTDHNEGLAVGL